MLDRIAALKQINKEFPHLQMTSPKLGCQIRIAKSNANVKLKKGSFDSEEKETLQKLAGEFGNNWDEIAERMPNRSRLQLQSTLDKLKRKDKTKAVGFKTSGTFKRAEDDIIWEMIAADDSYGIGTRIGEALGRNPDRCTERIKTLNTNDQKRKKKL